MAFSLFWENPISPFPLLVLLTYPNTSPATASSSSAVVQFSEYAVPRRCNIAKAFCRFRFRLSQPLTFAHSQPFIISNWCKPMPTRRFSAYLKGPYLSPSHSPFSPPFSKKPSRPLAWMPRTSLCVVCDGVAPHTPISQGFLITLSSCTVWFQNQRLFWLHQEHPTPSPLYHHTTLRDIGLKAE